MYKEKGIRMFTKVLTWLLIISIFVGYIQVGTYVEEGAMVNHEYISPGEYIIRLTVVDDRHVTAVRDILLIVP